MFAHNTAGHNCLECETIYETRVTTARLSDISRARARARNKKEKINKTYTHGEISGERDAKAKRIWVGKAPGQRPF